MPYIVVENMSAVVDRRRPIYASKQGTLWEGINGHISRGGDFEKRKAFVSTYTLPASETFGLQSVGTNIVVFGWKAELTGSLPSGVSYQALIHPAGSVLTDILCSTLFNGKIYVIAEYADGSILHFYGGQLVTDWYAGQVKPWMTTLNSIALHFASLIKYFLPTYSTSVVGAVLTIKGPIGTDYTITASDTNGGLLDDQAIALATTQSSTTGGTEVLATGSFAVTKPLTGYIDYFYAWDYYSGISGYYSEVSYVSVKVNGQEILSSSSYLIMGPKTTDEIAAELASAINSTASSPEYTATASGNVVTISA